MIYGYMYFSIQTLKIGKFVKVLHSICQQIWKTQQWLQDWKRSVFTPIPKKGNAKNSSNYHTIVLITCQQGNAQNPSSKPSTVGELRTSRCTIWIQTRQKNQRSNCQCQLDHRKTAEFNKKKKRIHFFLAQMVKNLPVMQETWVQFLDQEMVIT